MKGLEASTEECEVKINLVAHPLFVLTCVCRDKSLGLAALDNSVKLIQDEIQAQGGTFMIKSRPEVVGSNPKEGGGEESSSESGEEHSDSTEDEQDEGMGDLDEEALKALMEKTKDLDDEPDSD